MKSIITFLTSCAFLSTVLVQAQTNPPEPPQPPVVSSHNKVTSINTSSSYNTTNSNDSDTKGGNVSISISDNNGSYSLNARFPKNRNAAIYDVLRKELGEGKKGNKNRQTWEQNDGAGQVYGIELRDNKMSMKLDKNLANQDLTASFKRLGKLVRNAISGKDVDAERETQNLQREADKLQLEARRMQLESERMQREAERLKLTQTQLQENEQRNVSRYERDAERLAQESMRIAKKADQLSSDVANNGGMSDVVVKLLENSNTKIRTPFININNWSWPEAQDALLNKLQIDNMITSTNEVIFSRDKSGVFVNGKKVNVTQQKDYDRLLKQNGIEKSAHFKFYKKGAHIIIVDDRVRIKPLLEEFQNIGLISDLNTKTIIAINGDTTAINGQLQTNLKTVEINNILKKHTIIGAPGKTVIISDTGNYTLGYQGEKVHLGTWISND